MPSRVLLINSNTCDQPYPVFPLGLAHVDTALRKAGHTTRFYDGPVETDSLENIITAFAPDFVGISCRNVDDIQMTRQETYFDLPSRFTRQVRAATRAPVILGGSAFSLYPQPMLELTGADYGVQGEGEIAAVRLIAALERSASFRNVPGLVYREDDRIICNARQPMSPAELAPAERRSELAEYYAHRSSMLNIQTQRGCPLTCCYCTYPLIEGRAPRRRDPDEVAEELATIAGQGVKYVFITDSVFNTTNEHAAAVCEAILRRGVKMQWCCFLRPSDLDRDLIGLMARAGMTHVEFGSDSFCDPVLKEYGKSFTFEDILEAGTNAHAAKIHQAHFLICGGPGETCETLEKTFENSRRLPGAVIFGLAGMRIYPGTPLHERALREGAIRPATGLLRPVYYLSSALDKETVLAMLEDFKQRAPNWIVGELPASYNDFAARLRQRGVVGPLWEYFQALQRMT